MKTLLVVTAVIEVGTGVALLAYAAGPVLFGNSERRWFAAGAALDALDSQVFVRDFLRKMVPDPRGMARVEAASLSAGEQQVCLLLASKELAASMEEPPPTAFERGTRRFGLMLTRATMALVFFVLLVNTLYQRPLLESVTYARTKGPTLISSHGTGRAATSSRPSMRSRFTV